ncbi:MAG: 2-oxo-4-hydroxy-4-carboxy-5-ureidoimidazoline decarboxylase [Chloroflexota bacterium]
MPPLSICDVNALDRDAFLARFGGVFEHSPWIAGAAWEARPFADLPALHAAMCAVVRAAPEQARIDLIRAHPDLVGRAALAGTLTRESTAEQRAAGLDAGALTPAEVARFSEANAAYRERFGFPFVICARENRKEAILTGFARRLGNTPPQEIAAATAEIERIAWHRLADLVRQDPA